MKARILLLALAAALFARVGAAGAQCDFNAVAKARGMTTSLVRAFTRCWITPDGGINVVIDTQTAGGVPACRSVEPPHLGGDRTHYLFDPRSGKCTVQTKAKIENDCAVLEDAGGDPLGLPAGPCHVTYVKARCQGIVKSDGWTPINAPEDTGWSLFALSRLSINDPTSGDITVIDLPLTFMFGDPANGRIKLDGSSAEALATMLVGISDAALPTCTSLEISRLAVKDPDGLRFAVMGASTRAKSE